MSNAERPTLNNELKAGIAAAVISAKFPTPNDTRFSFQSSSSSRRSEERKFSRSASSIATYYEVGENLFGFRASFRRPIPESKRELVFGGQGHRIGGLGCLQQLFGPDIHIRSPETEQHFQDKAVSPSRCGLLFQL